MVNKVTTADIKCWNSVHPDDVDDVANYPIEMLNLKTKRFPAQVAEAGSAQDPLLSKKKKFRQFWFGNYTLAW